MGDEHNDLPKRLREAADAWQDAERGSLNETKHGNELSAAAGDAADLLEDQEDEIERLQAELAACKASDSATTAMVNPHGNVRRTHTFAEMHKNAALGAVFRHFAVGVHVLWPDRADELLIAVGPEMGDGEFACVEFSVKGVGQCTATLFSAFWPRPDALIHRAMSIGGSFDEALSGVLKIIEDDRRMPWRLADRLLAGPMSSAARRAISMGRRRHKGAVHPLAFGLSDADLEEAQAQAEHDMEQAERARTTATPFEIQMDLGPEVFAPGVLEAALDVFHGNIPAPPKSLSRLLDTESGAAREAAERIEALEAEVAQLRSAGIWLADYYAGCGIASKWPWRGDGTPAGNPVLASCDERVMLTSPSGERLTGIRAYRPSLLAAAISVGRNRLAPPPAKPSTGPDDIAELRRLGRGRPLLTVNEGELVGWPTYGDNL